MNLESTFVVLQPDQSAVPVSVTPAIWQELDQRFDDFEGRGVVAELAVPGSFVIVPRGTWHTARTSVATKMLFITPGEGTKNKALV